MPEVLTGDSEENINPEVGEPQSEVVKSPFKKLIRAQQAGDCFFAPETLVQDRQSGEFGLVKSLRKVHDPAYNMQRKTITELTVDYAGTGQRVVIAGETIPIYYYNNPSERERLKYPPLEIPEEYQKYTEISVGEEKFKLGELVTINGVLARIAIINPDKNKVGAIITLKEWAKQQRHTGYRKMYEVSPENLTKIVRKPDGTIQGQPRPFAIERTEKGFKVVE